jgi:hypothetical protein
MKKRILKAVRDKPDWLFHHCYRQCSRLHLLNFGPIQQSKRTMLDIRKLTASRNCSHVRGLDQGRFDGFPGRTA